MTAPLPLVRLLLTGLLGGITSWVLLLAPFPRWPFVIAAGAALILLLPRYPRPVAAFVVGSAASTAVVAAVWTGGWGCASEVNGVLVEHDCGERPYRS